MLRNKYSLCLLIVVVSCVTIPQKLDPDVLYVRNLKFFVDGTEYSGTALLPKKNKYLIEVRSAQSIDLLTIRTCAREFFGEKVGSGGGIIFWDKEQRYTYEYEPDPELELNKICPMEIAAYNAKSGAHAWGYIDFITDDYVLPATWHCNGRVEIFRNGVSICQNRASNKVKIKFDENVYFLSEAAGNSCKVYDKLEYRREFEFNIKRGSCYYLFMTQDKRKHRATAIGYSDIVLKGT